MNFRIVRLTFLVVIVLLLPVLCIAQNYFNKELYALRITDPPKIDGVLDEKAWSAVECVATNFIQRSPKPGTPASQKTEVKILYDNVSVYVGATLYDVSKDSILKEFTRRDDFGYADAFTVYFDTYDDDLNAFEFSVSAAGVQVDTRRTPVGDDRSWNAGWLSAVTIDERNWYVEMEIPFSALRFPKTPIQYWGLNFNRKIRRKNESDYWNEINPQKNGFINQFGRLSGILNVKSPVRLSVSPYISSYYNRYSGDAETPAYAGNRIKGGMDLRYGINDAFTLDMILVPDFGQVISDNKVLNLSPFEVQYNENRQFFKEGTELFDKGGYFYSRRIGGKPLHYNDVDDLINEKDEIISNPTESSLINATKISGRTRGGLGIGVLNAITSATYATVRDEAGETYELQTSPFSNYNVLALDQNLKNNSFVSLVNTSVIRKGEDYDANLTAGSAKFQLLRNQYTLNARGAVSQQYGIEGDNLFGYMTSISFAKTAGNFRSYLSYYMENDTYDPNDLGFIRGNNEVRTSGGIGYNIYQPFWKLLSFSSDLRLNYRRLYKPSTYTGTEIEAEVEGTFKNFFYLFLGMESSPTKMYDYFEPRVAGRYFVRDKYNQWRMYIHTDNRNRLALGSYIVYRNYDVRSRENISLGLNPRFRVNNRLSFSGSINFSNARNNVGFTDKTDEVITFGLRNIQTVNNIFNTKFTFNNKMDLSFRMRHYWSEADYKDYFTLGEEGDLLDSDYNENADRNYNAFNIDMVYTYTFAPASEISVVWKNSVNSDEDFLRENYFKNVDQVLNSPQQNSISIRLLYFLDYSMLTKKLKQNASEEKLYTTL